MNTHTYIHTQLALLIQEFPVHGFNQTADQKYFLKIQKFSTSKTWICHVPATIYLAFPLYYVLQCKQKKSTFASWSKVFDCVDHKNCGKFLKRWESKTTLLISWETCMQVKKQQLELDIEQWTGSKLGKEYIKAVYCHPAYLTSMQSTPCKMPAGSITSWNRNCWEKYQQPQICRWYHPNVRKCRGTEEPLDEGEGGEWKSQLKTKY